MGVLFSWTKPSINNRLSSFSGFSELKLSEYINEFELMTEVYGEKSVNIDCQKFITMILSDIVRIINIISNIIKRNDNYQLSNYYNSSWE